MGSSISEIRLFCPSIPANCDTCNDTLIVLCVFYRSIAARFRLQAKVDSKKQKQKLALLNGTATATPAIEAPKTQPEPDNRSVEDILAFLAEDKKPTTTNGAKKSGKGKKSKGAAKSQADSVKSDSKPLSTTQTSSKTSSNAIPATNEPNQDLHTTFNVESPKRLDFEKESPSSTDTLGDVSHVEQENDQDQRVDEIKKSLNLSASSNTSSSSATSSTTVSSSVSSSILSSSPTSSFDDDSQSTRKLTGAVSNPAPLTFPSMASTTAVAPASVSHAPSTLNQLPTAPQNALSTSGQLPLFPGLSVFPLATPTHSLAINTPHNVGSLVHMPTAPVYQPIQNFFPPTSSNLPAQLPPGLDLPPGLAVLQFSGETDALRTSGGAAAAPISHLPPQPSLYSYPVATPHNVMQTQTPQRNPPVNQMATLLAHPDSSFAMETSSFSLPPLTSSSSSAQYYWGLEGEVEEDEHAPASHSNMGSFEDPDFELELAQFRQSLELGIRRSSSSSSSSLVQNAKHTNYSAHTSLAGGNASAASLHAQPTSTASNHSTTTGNRPVGAY